MKRMKWANVRVGFHIPSLLLSVAAIACVMVPKVSAVDLESGVRNIRRYERWEAMEFRNPTYGFFLAARASTEDLATAATLNITAIPDKKRGGCKTTGELVFKLEKPAQKDSDTEGLIEMQLDGSNPTLRSARIVTTKNDQFLFVRVVDDIAPTDLLNHSSLLCNARRVGVAEFSLNGFADA